MAAVCRTLKVARSTAYLRTRPRLGHFYRRAEDTEVLYEILAVTRERASYGVRRTWAMVNRARREGWTAGGSGFSAPSLMVPNLDFVFRLGSARAGRALPESSRAPAAEALAAFFARPESSLAPPHRRRRVSGAGDSRRMARGMGPRRLRNRRDPHRFRARSRGSGAAPHENAGLSNAFPHYAEAQDDRGGFGFPIPDLPPGAHTLRITLVANDGGTTVLERSIVVLGPPPSSPTPTGAGR